MAKIWLRLLLSLTLLPMLRRPVAPLPLMNCAESADVSADASGTRVGHSSTWLIDFVHWLFLKLALFL